MDGFEILSGRKILLCEDHPINAQIIKALLEKQGMIVDTAENGQIGVEMLEKSAEAEYCAVLMDINMPVMDGLEAAGAIRALDRSDAETVPIIAMTADSSEKDVKCALDAGMNGFAAKPIDPLKLYSCLAEFL